MRRREQPTVAGEVPAELSTFRVEDWIDPTEDVRSSAAFEICSEAQARGIVAGGRQSAAIDDYCRARGITRIDFRRCLRAAS